MTTPESKIDEIHAVISRLDPDFDAVVVQASSEFVQASSCTAVWVAGWTAFVAVASCAAGFWLRGWL